MTVLLHGFWGEPRDWNRVLERLSLGVSVVAPDLYAPGDLAPSVPLPEWTNHFWHWVDTNIGPEPIQLVGYSMGARLLVNAAVGWPQRVRRALFLSGNPLLDKVEFAARENWESEWTKRFLNNDWAGLESQWQDQAVLEGSEKQPRRKTPEMRELLGLSLYQWSPRRHGFSIDELKALPKGMDWAFGALDQKYMKVAKALQELPVQGQISIIPQAGHRLISEAADFISQWIEQGS